ncbi:MAG: hypothetical protein K2X86_09420 [Cytophagaceae bacterium]|nr:hypothetical protein [Cytophagaceae bacterium]
MKYSILILTLTIYLSSCKKYEEGPALSFRSKEKRLANTWKIKALYLNDTAQTLSDEDMRFEITFEETGVSIRKTANGSNTDVHVGSWKFTDKKEKVETYFSYTYFGTPVEDITIYTIIKLKEKDLRLQEKISDTEVYEYHLIPA